MCLKLFEAPKDGNVDFCINIPEHFVLSVLGFLRSLQESSMFPASFLGASGSRKSGSIMSLKMECSLLGKKIKITRIGGHFSNMENVCEADAKLPSDGLG